MNRENVLVVLKILKTAYPDFYKTMSKEDAEDTINLWMEMFKNDDPNLVIAAVKNLIATFKYSPKIADVKEEMYRLTTKEENIEDILAEIRNAMHNSSYHATEEFEKLSPMAKQMVRNPSALREWAIMPNFNEQVWRGQMMKIYDTIKVRNKQDKMMLPEIKAMLTSFIKEDNLLGEGD